MKTNLVISSIIFIAVSVVVFGTSGYILSKSIRNSNYALVANYLHPSPTPMVTTFSSQEEPVVLGMATSTPSVEEKYAEYPNPPVRSLVNYMYANHFAFDYESRVIMARELGMTEYTGKSSQNALMLKILYYKDKDEKITQ